MSSRTSSLNARCIFKKNMNARLHKRFHGFRARIGVSRWDITPPAGVYLSPRDLYERNIYSVWQTPFASGGLEQLIEAAAAGLRELCQPLPA
jgi:hypothetical protein